MIRRSVVAVAVVVAFVAGGVAWATNPFVDIAGNLHEANIDAIYNAGITGGCTPTTYCPNNSVTRAQMGTFLARIGGFGKNLPKTNGRSAEQVYCTLSQTYPGAYPTGPCKDSHRRFGAVGDTGKYNSVAIGSDGFPVISYWNATDTSLEVLHCTDESCSGTPDRVILDNTDAVGEYSDITIGNTGFPVISYYDATAGDLKVARCTTLDCAGWFIDRVATAGNVGKHSSIAIAPDGFPVISYYDATNTSLIVLHCLDDNCAANTSTSVDTVGDVGQYSSLAIGTDGFPIISYYDETNDALKIAHCVDVGCEQNSSKLVLTDVQGGRYSSLTIGTDGVAVVSYRDSRAPGLAVAHCKDVTCEDASTTLVDSAGDVGDYTSIAIGTDGFPVISYYDLVNQDVKFARCTNLTCSAPAVVKNVGDIQADGQYTSIAVGTDGRSVISSYHQTNHQLQIVRPAIS